MIYTLIEIALGIVVGTVAGLVFFGGVAIMVWWYSRRTERRDLRQQVYSRMQADTEATFLGERTAQLLELERVDSVFAFVLGDAPMFGTKSFVRGKQ